MSAKQIDNNRSMRNAQTSNRYVSMSMHVLHLHAEATTHTHTAAINMSRKLIKLCLSYS